MRTGRLARAAGVEIEGRAMTKRRWWAVLLVGACASGTAFASPADPPQTGSQLSSNEVSPFGLEITDFRQRQPGDGEPVSEPTRAYVSYDQDNLNVVFVCTDDPSQVRARVVPREKITDDDRVGVFLDTFDDNQRAYAFFVNPLGIQRDGVITEGQSDDYTFDALWYSEGRLTASGYVVRMRIPFSSLRFARKSEQTWGLGLVRYIERKSEKSYWPSITDRVEGFVDQLGSAKGLRSISPGRRFQLVPYSVATGARFLDDTPQASAFRRVREGRLGLDAKAVLNDAVTLDVAIKPDFSQVEPDAPQVTINQRFEVRVDEKRPFFIENSGFFQTPIELFFSRRIQDPSGGARMTTKLGPWAIGALAMNDREPALVPAGVSLDGRQAYVGVLRVQRDLPGQSTLGLFASDRELAGDFSRMYAADTRLKLGKNWVVTGQSAQAEIRDPRKPRLWSNGSYFKVKRSGRYFDVSSKYTQFGPDFAAPLGYVKRVGFREVDSGCDYTFRPKKSLVTAWGPGANAVFNWGGDGRLQDASGELSATLEMPASTKFTVAREEAFELFRDREFRHYTHKIDAETQWLKWLTCTASFRRGTDVNHNPLKKQVPFVADAQETDLTLSLRPTSRLELKQALTYGWLRHTENDAKLGSVTRPVFTDWILTSKLKYQLSRELSIRAIANYEATIPNPALSREHEERKLTPDLLITYLLNPWTAVYAGYTERFENVKLVNGDVVEEPRSSRDWRIPSTSVDRQFFVKASYLVRF
jgi:hypothetical protein